MAEETINEIFWTDSAKISFQKIVDYLQKEWTSKEIEKFVNRTYEMISMLKLHPEMCRPSTKRKNVRIGILDNHTQPTHHYKPESMKIELLLFWGMKQNPSKLKY